MNNIQGTYSKLLYKIITHPSCDHKFQINQRILILFEILQYRSLEYNSSITLQCEEFLHHIKSFIEMINKKVNPIQLENIFLHAIELSLPYSNLQTLYLWESREDQFTEGDLIYKNKKLQVRINRKKQSIFFIYQDENLIEGYKLLVDGKIIDLSLATLLAKQLDEIKQELYNKI